MATGSAMCRIGGVALVKYFAKRQRKRERAIWSRRLLRQDGYTWTADEDEEGSAMFAMPYTDMRGACKLAFTYSISDTSPLISCSLQQ